MLTIVAWSICWLIARRSCRQTFGCLTADKLIIAARKIKSGCQNDNKQN